MERLLQDRGSARRGVNSRVGRDSKRIAETFLRDWIRVGSLGGGPSHYPDRINPDLAKEKRKLVQSPDFVSYASRGAAIGTPSRSKICSGSRDSGLRVLSIRLQKFSLLGDFGFFDSLTPATPCDGTDGPFLWDRLPFLCRSTSRATRRNFRQEHGRGQIAKSDPVAQRTFAIVSSIKRANKPCPSARKS
jgi:hypothetical protein